MARPSKLYYVNQFTHSNWQLGGLQFGLKHEDASQHDLLQSQHALIQSHAQALAQMQHPQQLASQAESTLAQLQYQLGLAGRNSGEKSSSY